MVIAIVMMSSLFLGQVTPDQLATLRTQPGYDRAVTHVGLGIPTPDTAVLVIRTPPGALAPCSLPVLVDGSPHGVACLNLTPPSNARSRLWRMTIPNLRPGHVYQVVIPAVGAQTYRVATAPPPTSHASFSLAFMSCHKPFRRSGKAGTLAFHNQELQTMAQMRRYLERRDVAFAIAGGDQLYTDDSSLDEINMFGGNHAEHMRFAPGDAPDILDELYRLSFMIPPLAGALETKPWAMTWDDHDIHDGWGSQGNEDTPEQREYFNHARSAFIAWQAARNPNFGGTPWPATDASIPAGDAASDFDWGANATFFIMDQRTNRSRTRVVHPEQLSRINEWLSRHADGPPTAFFLVSAGPLFTTSRYNSSWTEYLYVNAPVGDGPELLDDIADEYQWHEDYADLLGILGRFFAATTRHRLVVLSGDIHMTGVFSLYVRDRDAYRQIGHEVVGSGFTNAKEINSYAEDAVARFRAAFAGHPWIARPQPLGGDGSSSLLMYGLRERKNCADTPYPVCAELSIGTVIGSSNFTALKVEARGTEAPGVSALFFAASVETRSPRNYNAKGLKVPPDPDDAHAWRELTFLPHQRVASFPEEGRNDLMMSSGTLCAGGSVLTAHQAATTFVPASPVCLPPAPCPLWKRALACLASGPVQTPEEYRISADGLGAGCVCDFSLR